MRSPRFLRPHLIEITNYTPEVNYVKNQVKTVLNHVKVQGILKSNRNNVDITNQDDIIITIDCTDVDEVYTPSSKWDIEQVGWTLHSEGDSILFGDIRYSIIGYEVINPFGPIEFIEVQCRRI